jgi:ABC-type glycerol-3-phosphate transport system substrate-binding protein
MSFHLGKPILILMVAACASGVAILLRPAAPRADLTVWVFADSHARNFRDPSDSTPSLVDLYRQRTGQSVDVKLINGQALNIRLNAIFDRDETGPDVPDLVTIEISNVGRYFRPPLKYIGLLPLNDRLERDGLRERLLAARLAPWSKDGQIFGLPMDVHPVTITYRRDLFDQAGVDPATATTWPAFAEKCRAFQRYWAAHGQPNRRAIEFPRATADAVEVMLLQRHINVLSANNRPQFLDPRVAQTIAFYARCVAGPDAIGGTSTPGSNLFVQDFAHGDLCALITPDWRAGYIPVNAPELAGKVAMMPLPRFDPTDSPTATRGGTMMAIPRQARDPEASWQLMKFLLFTPEGMAARLKHTATLPPQIDAWADPIWHHPDAFYGGQKVGELYISLAEQLPARYVTPFSSYSQQALTLLVGRAVADIESTDGTDLEAKLAGWCAEANDEITRRIEFGKFE